MSHKDSRLTVNAAIEHLISEKEEGWLNAARIVVQFGREIPSGNSYDITLSGGTKNDTESVSGYAAGIGNATLHEHTKTEPEVMESGQAVERVGSYKLRHNADARVILFMHYRDDLVWKNVTDEPRPSQEYELFYDICGEPHTFALPIWEESTPAWVTLRNQVYTSVCIFFFALLGSRKRLRWHSVRQSSRSISVIHSTRPGVTVGSIIDRIFTP